MASKVNDLMNTIHITLTDRERERFIDTLIQTYTTEVIEAIQYFLKPSDETLIDESLLDDPQ